MPRHLLFDQLPWFTVGRWDFYTMSVDWLSIMMLGVVTFLASFIQLYSVGYMRGDDRFWWFFTVMSLFCAAMLGLVLSYDFLLMYMCWELVGLCSYLLIGFWYQERDNAEAAKKAFITTRVGDVGFAIGIPCSSCRPTPSAWTRSSTQISAGADRPHDRHRRRHPGLHRRHGQVRAVPAARLAAGRHGRADPVSALVHSATMVAAGVYLVGRAYPLFAASPVTMGVIATIGTITLIFAATIALTQRDIKKVLAYSTVSQLGLHDAWPWASAPTPPALFHLFTHAFFKALLFLGAGSVIHSMEAVLTATGQARERRLLDGRPAPADADHLLHLLDRLPLAGRHLPLVRLLEQGRDPGRRPRRRPGCRSWWG